MPVGAFVQSCIPIISLSRGKSVAASWLGLVPQEVVLRRVGCSKFSCIELATLCWPGWEPLNPYTGVSQLWQVGWGLSRSELAMVSQLKQDPLYHFPGTNQPWWLGQDLSCRELPLGESAMLIQPLPVGHGKLSHSAFHKLLLFGIKITSIIPYKQLKKMILFP